MEFVRGESITAYASHHKLSLRERIELFIQVCEGVQHAHQKGIIHRDLKPSNVLVTVRDDHAIPKIIDFGVAKATTQSLTERTLYTELGALVGTPEYMSPEQAEMGGLDIDTRTDVYALGVVLYELLTGTLPFDAKSLREKSLDEIRRTIREVDPPRPSTRVRTAATQAGATPSVDARRVAIQLRGDLDWIAMKALEKDRTRRYASVGELASDLQRHLEGLPVLASPRSSMYRVNKFVRRNKLSVAAAATVAVLLITSAAAMAIQARRIARERDRANAEAVIAKQIAEFLGGLFKVSNPSESRGSTLTAREILDRGAERVQTELAAQPEIEARLLLTIASVYNGLGSYEKAQTLARKAYDIRLRLFGADNADTVDTVAAIAESLFMSGKPVDAEAAWKDVLDRRQRLLGNEHQQSLMALNNYAANLVALGRWTDAEQYLRQALESSRRVYGDTSLRTITATANLGAVMQMEDKLPEAERYYSIAVEQSVKQRGADHPVTLLYMSNVAELLEDQGKLADAEQQHREVLAGRRKVLPARHKQLATTVVNLASVLNQHRRFDEAESLAREGLSIYEHTLPADHWQVAHAQTVLGEALSGQGLRLQAERLIVDGAEHILASKEPWPSVRRHAIRRVVGFYVAAGKPADADVWRAKLSEPRTP
jgi:non-specific serine/threonine protein kinase/serine/threonine-protein kinase